jgi:transcriptional regulator with XRE-family HTH domain
MAALFSIGDKVNQWGKEQGLTMQQLAKRCDLTAGYISQIEHDKVSPSVATLRSLAKALGMRIIDFFADEIIDEPTVLSKDKWTRVIIPDWESDSRQLVRIAGTKRMQPFYTVIPPGGTCAGSYSQPGEEFGFVMEGELELYVGSEQHRLGPATSFYYPSLLPHWWENDTDKPCKLVWVVSPPSW